MHGAQLNALAGTLLAHTAILTPPGNSLAIDDNNNDDDDAIKTPQRTHLHTKALVIQVYV